MFLTRLTTVVVGLLAAVTVLSAQTPKTAAPAKPQAPAAAPKSKLPAAVEAAFKKAYPNAIVKASSSEKEDGKLQYEIESVDGTTKRDVVYLADGTLVAAEEEINAADVPAPVITALTARYPKAKITKYEKLTKGTAISYEMALTGAAVNAAEIAPDGTFISPKPVKK